MNDMTANKVLMILLTLLVFAACKRSTMSPAEFLSYYQAENSEEMKTIKASGLAYSFRALPPEFIALKENTGANGQVDQTGYSKRLAEIKDYLFVKIKITNLLSNNSILQTGVKSEAEMQQRTQYYNFEAGKNLYCICGKDTLKTSDYQFEESYNLSNYAIISAVFPACSSNEITIHFDDKAANNYGVAATLSYPNHSQLKF